MLEEQLKERQDILSELAPRAVPNIDPVAYTTFAATRRTVDQISAALERIDAGTYGSCTGCGGAIATARLEVLPYAHTCIDCQSRAEHS